MWIRFSRVKRDCQSKSVLGKQHHKSRKQQACNFTCSMGFLSSLLLSLKAGSKENEDLNEVLSKIDRHL